MKVKNFQRNHRFFESENFQNLKMIESKKISINFNEITESEKILIFH